MPEEAGFIGGPFVPTEDVARDIFKVMVGTSASFNAEKYPVIEISDGGTFWQASQSAINPEPGYRGGGQLYLRIDKCTGAVSHAAYNR